MAVSQISTPMRILLIGAVVFLAAWFTLLSPKAAETCRPPTTDHDRHARPATTTAATRRPKPGHRDRRRARSEAGRRAAAIPAEALAKLPKDVAKRAEASKTLVLGVFADDATDYRPLADDDRYVRNALRDVNRYDGEVFVKTVPASQALQATARWSTTSASTSRPSVVVIDRNLKGRVLTGYVDRIAINQVIADARARLASPRASRTPTCATSTRSAGATRRASTAARTRRSAARRPLATPTCAVAKVHRTYAVRTAALKTPGEVPRPREALGGAARRRKRSGPRRWPRRIKTRSKADDRKADAMVDLRRLPQARPRLRRGRPHRLRAATAGRRLRRSWTASASKSTSPRPTGAASCFPGASTAPPAARSAVT